MAFDFSDLKLNDLSPIYSQIIEYVKAGIITGALQDGDELPSRRFLSAALSVNPNTVQKAYHQLEEEGLLISFAGAKSLVTVKQGTPERLKEERLEIETERYLEAVRQIGCDVEEIKKKFDQMWKSQGGGKNDAI